MYFPHFKVVFMTNIDNSFLKRQTTYLMFNIFLISDKLSVAGLEKTSISQVRLQRKPLELLFVDIHFAVQSINKKEKARKGFFKQFSYFKDFIVVKNYAVFCLNVLALFLCKWLAYFLK